MPSTYTTNNGIEKVADGEQEDAWAAPLQTNWDIMDRSLDGATTVTLPSVGTSGSPNDLAISDGSLSDGQYRYVTFDDGGDLGGTAYVRLTPNDASKIMIVTNSLSGGRSILLFQGTYSASNDFELANGETTVVHFNGGGASATVTEIIKPDLAVYAANPLTAAELQQLQNIDSSTMTTTQWGYVGAMDQGVATSSSPQFAGVKLGGTGAANTISDFEVNTFTPSLSFANTSIGLTYTSRSGRYTKVGDMVFFSAYIVINSNGSSSGLARLEGLPFQASTTDSSMEWIVNVTVTGGVLGSNLALIGRIKADTASEVLIQYQNSTGHTNITETELTDGASIFVTGTYHTDS